MHHPVLRINWRLIAVLALVALIYWPGLFGGWLFDDYPNIVDNQGVQPHSAALSSLFRAALSSPASELKRPISSLTFAANYLGAGLDPFWMKLTNLGIHLLNGVLAYFLASIVFRRNASESRTAGNRWLPLTVAAGWLLLPINITAVLYTVQRMESLANVFVMLGLLGYISARLRMLSNSPVKNGIALCFVSITLLTALGTLAKETAVMLPLYALLAEWALFNFRSGKESGADLRIAGIFLLCLVLPAILGLSWLMPPLLQSTAWATRDFTMSTRLLTEARVVIDYLLWTLLPLPQSLSFYHDDYVVSQGLLSPWTTIAALALLLALAVVTFWLRRHSPIAALGIALFLACQLLTGTVLPLELVYEHRNYFASFGLVLALVDLLFLKGTSAPPYLRTISVGVMSTLLLWWLGVTTTTAYAWGDPLRLAQELARRAPNSPRAQYELGRTYIIYSGYNQASPYTKLAYAALEKAASLPRSSILPQQALIFMNARMGIAAKDQWWDSLTLKLVQRNPDVQDESSLISLTDCMRSQSCDLPKFRMTAAYQAALAHDSPSGRLLAAYSNYSWDILGDKQLAEKLIRGAIAASPTEPAYRASLVHMLALDGHCQEGRQELLMLEKLNFGNNLGSQISTLADALAHCTPEETDPHASEKN